MKSVQLIVDGFNGKTSLRLDALQAATLDKAKYRVLKKNWDYVALVVGLPSCLSGDTLIKTSQGNKQLRGLSNQTILVESIDLNKNKIVQGKAKVFPTGIKDVFEIETIDGRKVKATKEHTFFIKRDTKIIEIKLEDLKEGDDLICE